MSARRTLMGSAESVASASGPAAGGPSVRYHAFDSLRAAAMLLGVFFHSALSFSDPPLSYWMVADPHRHPLVSVFAWASHGFRMNVFFVMAGFFARLLISRYRPRTFAVHRLRRIGVPFVVSVATLALLLQLIAPLLAGTGHLRRLPPAPYHYWFLEYLLLYSFGVWIAERLRPRLVGRCAALRIDRGMRRLIALPARPFVLAVPTIGLMYAMGQPVVGLQAGFVPQLDLLGYYGLFFVFGYLLYAQAELLPLLIRHHGLYLIGAACLLVTPLLLFVRPFGAAERLAVLVLSALFSWLMVFGVIGLFLRVFRRNSPWLRYLSDSAYWVYLIHIPVVPLLQVWLAGVALPGAVKYLLINAITLALLYASYHLFVRYTWIGRALHGPRMRVAREQGAALRDDSAGTRPEAPPGRER